MNLAERIKQISPFHVMEVLSRAKALERQGRDIIHLEIGEPDFPTPPLVVEAALGFIRGGNVKYTPAGGLPELRESIAEYYGRRYGVRVGPQRIFVTPGASGGFLLSLGLALDIGGEVALADPGYPCYANFVRLFGGSPRLVPVDESTGFHLNAELLRKLWDDRMTGIVTASPANPTGTMMAADTLQGLLEEADRQAGFVISDEIYHGLEYGPSPSPTALAFSPRAFVVNSFSKYFGMTGWRLGWVVVPEEYIEFAERLAQNIFISAPTHSQVAALASFTEENLQELERRRFLFKERRDFLCAGLKDIGFVIKAQPEGAFYIYADCGRFSKDSYGFAMGLLSEAGVAVTPGLDFGTHSPGRFLRFSYTVPVERLGEALARIDRYARGMPPATAT
ncbi:aminotransferase class I/II-fold pyridoxal phosphate-dependent enzyme [Methylomagnum sp.]